jgi:hypothetical protein
VDAAAVVGRAATDVRLRRRILQVTGQLLTMNELARALQCARGWQGAPRNLPRPLLRALSILAAPVNPAFARQNRTALAMDTVSLSVDPAVGPQDRGPATMTEVLARSLLN